MKKGIFTFLLTLSLVTTSNLSTFAMYGGEGETDLEASTLSLYEERISAIEDINFKYDFVEIDTNPNFTEAEREQLLEFDSVEEFEDFLENLNQTEIVIDLNEEPILQPFGSIQTYAADKNGISTATTWKPIPVGANYFCWFNADLSYRYNYDSQNRFYFKGVNNVTSYLTGLNIMLDWIQTSYSANITTGDYKDSRCDVYIKGYWKLGVSINGFDVGAKISDGVTCYWGW